jgi:hypothetical protein
VTVSRMLLIYLHYERKELDIRRTGKINLLTHPQKFADLQVLPLPGIEGKFFLSQT